MLKHNFATYGTKVLFQIIWEFLYFPIWWYTVGFIRYGRKILNFLSYQQSSLGLFVWIKNLFVPMYGQHDIAGRLISFFVRIVQIIYRSLAMIVVLALSLLAALLWLLLLPALILAIILQLF
ncbi:MAG: hypothetical protein NTX66_03695 [Candidatus Falkowbacteria bacterium]|nr:hypothetical protein [Candidatus Falkowbacteria bacterium]